MSGRTTAEVLRRIARPPQAPTALSAGLSGSGPLTPARALRLALTRAADRSIRLALEVAGVTQEEARLDDLLAGLGDDLMLLELTDADGPAGLVGLDPEARAAVIEVQALGRPAPRAPEPRQVTAADVALAAPFLDAFLTEVAASTAGTALEGWVGEARLAGRLADAREAGLVLPDGPYRMVRLSLDLGAGGRQGLLVLVLRVAPAAGAEEPPEDPGWGEQLSAQVLRAQTPLRAVLHRIRLTLDAAEGLREGQVLPLPGVTVASVRIEGQGGVDLGPARLGQVAGMRAVRLEAPLAPRLAEMRVPAWSLPPR